MNLTRRLPRGRHVAGDTADDYRWWVLAITSIGASAIVSFMRGQHQPAEARRPAG